jgi:hypothetical protein
MAGTGEKKLKSALRNFHHPRPKPKPINISPSNTLEALLIERILYLETQISQLHIRINWLIGLIISTLVAIVIKYVLG